MKFFVVISFIVFIGCDIGIMQPVPVDTDECFYPYQPELPVYDDVQELPSDSTSVVLGYVKERR